MRLHLTSGDSPCIVPRQLESSLQWYREKLGCREPDREEMEWLQSDVPPSALLVLDEGIGVYFYPSDEGAPQTVPVLFSSKLKSTHMTLSERGVVCTPIQQDGAGRSFFEFRDVDGNVMEVCAED